MSKNACNAYLSLFLLVIGLYRSIVLCNSCNVKNKCRCFPNEECWPSKEDWDYLNKTVHGRLEIPYSPIQPCLDNQKQADNPHSCIDALNKFGKDPYFVQTFSGGTQSTGISTKILTYFISVKNLN